MGGRSKILATLKSYNYFGFLVNAILPGLAGSDIQQNNREF